MNNLEEIAIVGMAGRFPGAKNIEEFWQNLAQGVESISTFTEEELLAAGIDAELLQNPQYVKAKGALEDIDLFDANFFGYSPREAETLDPQQRFFLECAWEALENAGYDSETYPGKIGVFAGTGCNSYLLLNLASHAQFLDVNNQYQTLLGNDKDFLTTRVSYKLNLTGPSIDIQTACSTSLVATNLACQSLLNYQCDMALVGGVTITVPQKAGYLYQEGGIFSPDGHCRAFDANAQGTVIGNGVGIVVLKRLEDAIADRDSILAVIKATVINNDGSQKVGYTAPSVNGQAEAIAEAIGIADINPETLGYIETHGTGTNLGDPIEIAALTKAFSHYTQKRNFCAIGSVKSNIGHLDAAAGVTGLIKAVLALKYQQIPPSLHFEKPNPKIDFINSPFYVNTQLKDWKINGVPRRAGVSSLGIGGTNAHVILEEFPNCQNRVQDQQYQLLVLSAKTNFALETATQNLVDHLKSYPELNLADVAYTLAVGRRNFECRRMVVCQTIEDVIDVLSTPNPRVLTQFQTPENASVVFMFPGQGSQYVDMGRELYETEPVYKQEIDHCCHILKPYLGIDLRTLIYPKNTDLNLAADQLKQTHITQPALFVIEYALAKLLTTWGIIPHSAIGHSIGEYVAACLAGVFSLEDALKLVAIRGKLMQQLPAGSMLAVSLPAAEVTPFLTENLSLAANNAPTLSVISGSHEAIQKLEQQLQENGIDCRKLQTSHAFHSDMMEPILEPFIAAVKQIQLNAPKLPFISNITGTWITPEQATDPSYWAQHLRQPVQFVNGISELLKSEHNIFLEVGPGRTLSTFALKVKAVASSVISTLRHPKDEQSDIAFLLNSLGRLWLAGIPINWQKFYEDETCYRIPLPAYPFERQRYWIEPQKHPNKTSNSIESSTQLISETTSKKPVLNLHSRPNLATSYIAPSSETEKIIAQIWQELLGIETIGIYDNFFELGGDSILGLQVSSRINQAGLKVTPKQLFEFPTIAELAKVAATTQIIKAEQGLVIGNIPLTSIQHWFFEQNFTDCHHWNQAVLLEAQEPLNPALLEKAVEHLLQHHDALRLRFEKTETGWQQIASYPDDIISFSIIDLSAFSAEVQDQVFRTLSTEFQSSLNLAKGPIFRVIFFNFGNQRNSRLLMIIHHLAVDILSWRILIEDLQTTYLQLSQNQTVKLPRKTTSIKQWSEKLIEYANSTGFQSQPLEPFSTTISSLPRDFSGENLVASEQIFSTWFSVEETQKLRQEITTDRLQVEDILLTALTQTFAEWTGMQSLFVDLEGSGREVQFEDIDLSRTVGWFTNLAPVLLNLDADIASTEALKQVKTQLRRIPNEGLDYGVWRYLCNGQPHHNLHPEVMFLYLGQIDQILPKSSLFQLSETLSHSTRSLNGKRTHLFEIRGVITESRLRVDWLYSNNIYRIETVKKLSEKFAEAVRVLLSQSQSSNIETLTPSDFAEFQWSQWNQEDLNQILSAVNQSQGS